MTELIDISHATIMGVQMLADRKLKITLCTNELDSKSVSDLFDAIAEDKQVGSVRISRKMEGGKSHSQRLRNVIYRDWELNYGAIGDSELHYESEMDKIIEEIKLRLPETRYDEPL